VAGSRVRAAALASALASGGISVTIDHPEVDAGELALVAGEIVHRVNERDVALTLLAVISLDTTLIVTSYFGALPKDTVVFEVDPEDLNFGDGFSPRVEDAVAKLVVLLEKEVAGHA